MTATLSAIVTIIVHTPLWVWPLYAVLLLLGFRRTRDGILPLWRFMILPVIVTGLAILSVVGSGTSGLTALLLGLAVGGPAGWLLEPVGATRRLPDGAIWVAGEWWSLAQIAVVLVFRYSTSIIAIRDPMLGANPTWHFGTLFASTALSAVFLGRTAVRVRVYLTRARARA